MPDHPRTIQPIRTTLDPATRAGLAQIHRPGEPWTFAGAIREAVRYWIENHRETKGETR